MIAILLAILLSAAAPRRHAVRIRSPSNAAVSASKQRTCDVVENGGQTMGIMAATSSPLRALMPLTTRAASVVFPLPGTPATEIKSRSLAGTRSNRAFFRGSLSSECACDVGDTNRWSIQ